MDLSSSLFASATTTQINVGSFCLAVPERLVAAVIG
jgi:hypothetical protein